MLNLCLHQLRSRDLVHCVQEMNDVIIVYRLQRKTRRSQTDDGMYLE